MSFLQRLPWPLPGPVSRGRYRPALAILPSMDPRDRFQRPASMPRAIEQAKAEPPPGAYRPSRAFEAAGWTPGAKPVGVYRRALR